MTWRLMVGGRCNGRVIDVDDRLSRIQIVDWADDPFDPGYAAEQVQQTYDRRAMAERVPHPCVPGVDRYRDWTVLVLHVPGTEPDPDGAWFSELLLARLRSDPDLGPDSERLGPRPGCAGPSWSYGPPGGPWCWDSQRDPLLELVASPGGPRSSGAVRAS